MKKNKIVGLVMIGVVSLGIMGVGGYPVFAATFTNNDGTSTTTSVNQPAKIKNILSDEIKQKVQSILDQLKSDLANLGAKFPVKDKHDDVLANLDNVIKEKAHGILDKVKAAEMWANLDDATKEKAQELIDQAQTKLKNLGVDGLLF